MGKIPEDITDRAHQAARTVRIAYTLNNTQPVRCSIIDDQPLFYMDMNDYEEEFDDALGLEEDWLLDRIERGLESLKEKISAADAQVNSRNSEADIAVFERMMDDATSIGDRKRKNVGGLSAEKIAKILRNSRLAAAYMDSLSDNRGSITMVDSPQARTADYDRSSGTIILNPNLPTEDRILLAARELRRAWQHRSGALVHPLTFHPDQAILVHRAQEADLAASMVRIAWELQLAGENAAWNRLESSSMCDLARAFSRDACLDFRAVNNGSATAAVFESWFLSERCRHADRALIQEMLADYQGYVFESEQPSRSITAGLLTSLGSMPFGKNYLSPFIPTIMSDPVFTEVRDRSNANFLWFIKFERSFRETEQELQKTQSVRSRDIPSGLLNEKNKRRIGDDEKTENITVLPHGRARADFTRSSGGKRDRSPARSADIIRFPQLSRE